MGSALVKVRGKVFTEADLQTLQFLIASNADKGRIKISRAVCKQMGWIQPNGVLQDMACRDILLKLERRGILTLPPRKPGGRDNRRRVAPPLLELPMKEEPLTGRVGEFSSCQIVRVGGPEESRRWNGWVERYHYLGYRPFVGRSLKYWIKLGERDAGVIGWGSPSWKLGGRDKFIGWDSGTRERNLQGIANNTRFLILPWVRVKYLASRVLSLCARQVPADWRERYGVELFLFETFVDAARYRGTCYIAANWVHVGQSQGSSKSGDSYHYHGQRKEVYVYPLVKDFRERLCR